MVEAGGGVVAHGRRLQAAVLLFQTVEGEVTALPFSSVCLPLLSFSVVSLYPPGLLSSFLPRFKLFLPLRLSLSVVPFLFGSVLCFSLFPLLSVLSPFSSLSSVFLGLFIEPRGGAFYGCTWGAGAAAVGRPFGCSCRDVTPLFSAWRAAGGRPAGVAGEVRLPRFSGKACGQERGSTREEEKPTILLSSPAARPWEEERGTVSFKTTPFRSSSSFFFFLA